MNDEAISEEYVIELVVESFPDSAVEVYNDQGELIYNQEGQ
jgi:hypothetical protein